MNDDSFHATLSSNSNLNVCPDNKPTDYTVHLPKPIKLTGKWEVKLTNILIPYNWKTATFDSIIHCVYLPKSSEKEHTGGSALSLHFNASGKNMLEQCTVAIEPSDWDNTTSKMGKFSFGHTFADNAKSLGDEVALRINVALSTPNAVKFVFDRETATGQFVANGNAMVFIYIHGSPKLARFLGCRYAKTNVSVYEGADARKTTRQIGDIWFLTEAGPVVMSSFVALDQIYIYSDVVKNQIVSDTEAPLLATFAMPRKTIGEKHQHEFLNEKYLPLDNLDFQRIRVRLATGRGKPIPFATWSSEVTVEMHFRKRI
jgi:hypothetical protein